MGRPRSAKLAGLETPVVLRQPLQRAVDGGVLLAEREAHQRFGLVLVGVLPNPAKQYLVKRVIGVAGDKVECCAKNKKLMINGVEIDEPYIFAGNTPSDTKFNVTVPEGKIWVMGDHRGASADSRFHQDDINQGMVPTSKVTGRVIGIIWPIKNLGIVSSYSSLK